MRQEAEKIHKLANSIYKKIFKRENDLSDFNKIYIGNGSLSSYIDKDTQGLFCESYFNVKNNEKALFDNLFTELEKAIKKRKSKYNVFIVNKFFIENHKKKNYQNDENGKDIFDGNIPANIFFIIFNKHPYIFKSPFKLTRPLSSDDYNDTKREQKIRNNHIEFKKKNGFDPSECWNLDRQIALFVLPRLMHFRKIHHGLFNVNSTKAGSIEKFAYYSEEETNLRLDKMINAFKWIAFNAYYSSVDENEFKNVKEGLKLFAEHYFDLWD